MVLLSLEVLVIQGKGIVLTISDVSFLVEEAPPGYFGSCFFLILSLRTWSELSFENLEGIHWAYLHSLLMDQAGSRTHVGSEGRRGWNGADCTWGSLPCCAVQLIGPFGFY